MSTAFQISCPGCGKLLKLTSKHLGKKVRCPKCSTVVRAGPKQAVVEAPLLEPLTSIPSSPPPDSFAATPVTPSPLAPRPLAPHKFARKKSASKSTSRGALTGWIVAAVFGGVTIVLLGGFVIYLLANRGSSDDDQQRLAQLDDGSGQDVRDPGDSQNTSGSRPRGARSQQPDKLPNLPDFKLPSNRNSGRSSVYRYDWNDRNLTYQFNLVFNKNTRDEVDFSGSTTYTPNGKPHRSTELEEERYEAEGTGFVIHPDGLIGTCAHVVNGASDIDVTVNGKKHRAVVVATDYEHDLALLKIQARNLPYLSIAPARTVEQGEAVTVLGFPLSNLLGSSIKVTQGTILGFSDDKNQVQIDATVNPGNSGGPVVDRDGNVVGVASALLDAVGISSVAFAVSVERLTALLKRNQISWASENQKQSLNDVKRAVAFIHCSGHGFDRKTAKSCRYRSTLTTSEPNGRVRPRAVTDKGNVVFDASGAMGAVSEQQMILPGVFENLCQIGIEQLPRSATQQAWTDQDIVLMEIEDEADPSGGYPGDFRSQFPELHLPPGFPQLPGLPGRREPQQAESHISIGLKTVSYEIISDDRNQLVVAKSVQLDVYQPANPNLAISIEFAGEYVFNKREKRLDRGSFVGMVIATEDERVKSQIPISMTYSLDTR